MPSPDDIFRDMENDRKQREAEIRLIENIEQRTSSEDERAMLLRSLTLLIYAHLEGFCKFALLSYTGYINSEMLECGEVVFPIRAASLRDVFAALRNPNSKSPEFRRDFPADTELHMLWRERTFVERYDDILKRRVEVPDTVVDTQSNLNTKILKKNLFQLGLDYPIVERHRSSIDQLLGVRNAISHGDVLRVPRGDDVRRYSAAAFEVMSFVQESIFDALKEQKFKKLAGAR